MKVLAELLVQVVQGDLAQVLGEHHLPEELFRGGRVELAELGLRLVWSMLI